MGLALCAAMGAGAFVDNYKIMKTLSVAGFFSIQRSRVR